ncbi:MAG: hypothetical protein IDH49_09465 [Gammaproteobacteria bacterium]|nr:hypothetical protein [Gammaproteobacteria bacterium]
MLKNVYKIVSLLLAFALVVMPLRLAHADAHATHAHPASLDAEVSDKMPGHPAMSGHDHGHAAMNGEACDMPSPPHCDQDQTSKAKPHHCYTDAHCCVALLDSPLNAAHAAPSLPKPVLSVAVTGITVPAETKPPRNIL